MGSMFSFGSEQWPGCWSEPHLDRERWTSGKQLLRPEVKTDIANYWFEIAKQKRGEQKNAHLSTSRNVSSEVGPCGTGPDLRPSSSTRTPEWFTNEMKWWKTGSLECAFVWPSSAICSWLPENSGSVSSSFPRSSTVNGRAFSRYLPRIPSGEMAILWIY